MPVFRLVADRGEPAEQFDARDADAAEAHARRLSTRYPTARDTGYLLEQEVDGRWQLVRAWVPRRIACFPAGTETRR